MNDSKIVCNDSVTLEYVNKIVKELLDVEAASQMYELREVLNEVEKTLSKFKLLLDSMNRQNEILSIRLKSLETDVFLLKQYMMNSSCNTLGNKFTKNEDSNKCVIEESDGTDISAVKYVQRLDVSPPDFSKIKKEVTQEPSNKFIP